MSGTGNDRGGDTDTLLLTRTHVFNELLRRSNKELGVVLCESRQMSNDNVRHQHVIHRSLPALPPPDPTGSRGSGVGAHKGLILNRKSQKPGTQISPLPFPSSRLKDVMSELGHRELPPQWASSLHKVYLRCLRVSHLRPNE